MKQEITKKTKEKKSTILNPSEQIRQQQQSKTERNEITTQQIWSLENRKQRSKIPLKSILPSPLPKKKYPTRIDYKFSQNKNQH